MTDDQTLLTPQDDLQPGALFAGKYRIQRLLGKGGFGAVYLVKNEEIGWEMALKLLHPEHGADPAYRARFLREMGLARDLLHPNAVPVRDAGVESGRLYYTMDFVPGKSLKDVIQKEGRIAPARAAEWMKQVLSFLTFLHGKHYIHRDLKPDNLIVQDENGVERIRVLDLGIAKSIAASAETVGLTGGSVIGTPHYMAPEHAAGDEVDARIDLYAMGVIFYECCRGARPFHEPTLQKLFHSIRTQEAPPLPKVVPGFPEAMWQVIARALEKDRELRYRDAKAFVAAIDQVLPELLPQGTVVQDPGVGQQEPSGPTIKQDGGGSGRKMLTAVVAVLVLAAAGVGVMFALGDTTAPSITSSVPPADGVVATTPFPFKIFADDVMARATIAGNEATVTGSEAVADVAFSGTAGPRDIKVFLWDKAGNRRESIVTLKWEPVAGSAAEPLKIVRQVPAPTEPQKQPFLLKLTANRTLSKNSTIDGKPADVDGVHASRRIDRFVKDGPGRKDVPVVLMDDAGNPPCEDPAVVLWAPDAGGGTPPAPKELLPGLVAMPDARTDPSGYPTLVKHTGSGIEFVLFPATGKDGFGRGKTEAPSGEHKPSSPRHNVLIETPFYLSRSLVTREQYDKHSVAKAPNLQDVDIVSQPSHPVTGLKWQQAESFCKTVAGGRLPTEAEWEWARYQALGVEAQEFPWPGVADAGKNWANTNEDDGGDSFSKLAPATSFPVPEIYKRLKVELFDLVGNAAEFCRDEFQPYWDLLGEQMPAPSANPIADPGRRPNLGSLHAIRGASHDEDRTYCNLVRRRHDADFAPRLHEVGFRVCIPLK